MPKISPHVGCPSRTIPLRSGNGEFAASPATLTDTTVSTSTKLVLVAERLLRRPDCLEKLCKHLYTPDGPQSLELMIEMPQLTQERGKAAAYSASVLKKIIEGWIDKDFEEMGMDKAATKEKIGLKRVALHYLRCTLG